jgi:hypothetical protein
MVKKAKNLATPDRGGGEDGMLLALSRSVETAIKEKLSE